MRVDNIAALSLQSMLSKNKLNNSREERTSSGLKISDTKKTKSEVEVNEKMKSQIRELSNADERVDSNEYLKEAKKTYSDTTDILNNMQQLVSKLASKEADRDGLTEELKELSDEFVKVSTSKYFNSKWLKNGLDPGNIADISTDDNIMKSLLNISSVKEEVFKTGLYFEELIKSENLSASKSRIHDVDMVEKVVSLTKKNMLNQSAMAILAQANKKPEQIMKLLE